MSILFNNLFVEAKIYHKCLRIQYVIRTEEYDPKNEEIRIVQKLEVSENANDFDLLIDLLNIRKYTYVNFKNFSTITQIKYFIKSIFKN